MNRLNAGSHTEVSEATSLDVHAALVRGTNEVPFGDSFQLSYPDKNIEDIYVGAQLTHQLSPTHELQLRSSSSRQRSRQRWETCLPTVALLPEMFTLWRANPAYADAIAAGMIPSGGSATDDALAAAAIQAIRTLGPRALAPTCVTPNEDSVQTRDEIELQDTYVFSERLRSVAGFGARRQRGESQTFLGGTQTSHLYWLFGNVEGRPAPWLTINAGGYFEHDSISPSTFSPRAAVNVRLSPGQTLRFVVSKGTRSPDIFEQRANWTFTFTDLNPPLNGSTTARLYQSARSAGNLVSERIVSREIGYLLNLQRYGLLLDAKAFHDRLSDLISERTNLAGFGASNRGAVTLQGAELQATIQWSPKQSAFLNYAYLENRGATNPLERSQYSRHSGSIGMSQAFDAGWQGAVAYYGSSGDGLAESRYGRLDLLASKTGNAGDLQWSATFALRRLDNPVVSHASGPVDTIVSRYNDRLQMYVQFALRVP
jgi:iron complex outermembrane receptor protein